jgi:hypothetical protein
LDTGVIPQKIHRHFYLPTPNRDGPNLRVFLLFLLVGYTRCLLLRFCFGFLAGGDPPSVIVPVGFTAAASKTSLRAIA